MEQASQQEQPVELHYEVKQVDWEDGTKGGFFERLWNTWRRVMFQPLDFFREMPPSGGMLKPLLFALILSGVGATVGWLMQMAMQGCITSIGMAAGSAKEAMSGLFAMGFGLGFLILIPFFIVAWTFIAAGVLHLFVKMLGGVEGFEATFRVVCYAQAPNILSIIPFVGSLAGIYTSVLEGMGVYKVHDMTPLKAVLAIVLPIILIVFVIGAIVAVVAIAVVAAAQAAA